MTVDGGQNAAASDLASPGGPGARSRRRLLWLCGLTGVPVLLEAANLIVKGVSGAWLLWPHFSDVRIVLLWLTLTVLTNRILYPRPWRVACALAVSWIAWLWVSSDADSRQAVAVPAARLTLWLIVLMVPPAVAVGMAREGWREGHHQP